MIISWHLRRERLLSGQASPQPVVAGER
jgi:hypothetical protein